MYALCSIPGGPPRPSLVTDFSDYANAELSTQGWTYSDATLFSAVVQAAGATGHPVSSKRVKIDKTSGTGARFATLDSPAGLTNLELLVHILLSPEPTGANLTIGQIIARYTNTTHYYVALPRTTSGAVQVLEIGKEAGSGAVSLDNTAVNFDDTEFWWIRFRIIGTSLQAKMWRHTASEPASWQVSDTDSSNASGKVGLATFFAAFNYYCDFFSLALGGATAPGPSG